VDKKPVQRVHPDTAVDFNVDYYEAGEEQARDMVKAFIKPFDLHRAPLLRAGLIKTGKTKYVCMIDMYHIVSDGVSSNLLVKDFLLFYNGKELPRLRVQYKDFARWQDRLSASGEIEKQEEYWLNRFKGEIPVLDLPTDYPGASQHRLEQGRMLKRELEKTKTMKLYEYVKDADVTVYMMLLSVFNVFLSKYARQEDIVVGVPVAGRKHADLERLIGMFVNMLAMRNFPHEDKTWREFLGEVKENAVNAYENQDYQFEELVKKLGVSAHNRNPLCNVVFVLGTVGLDSEENRMGMTDLKVSPYPFEDNTVKFDLQLEIIEDRDNQLIRMEWNYPCALFKSSTVETMARHFVEILEQVLENPDVKLRDVSFSHALAAANTGILSENKMSFGF
jgi:hypothetical protein